MIVVDAQAQIGVPEGWEGMDADGGNPRNLTNHPDRRWSPDGKVSYRERYAHSEIYVMDADGGNPNLTNQS